jgi:hypothetical protein
MIIKYILCYICTVGLTAGTLAVHVEESCPNHLLLVMHRLSEQQAIIVQLHKRVSRTKPSQLSIILYLLTLYMMVGWRT